MPRPGDDPSPYWTVDETGADARENYALAAATAVAAALEQRRLPLEVEQQIMSYARPKLQSACADELDRVWAAARDVAERGRLDGRGPPEPVDILRFARSEFAAAATRRGRDVLELGGVEVGPPLPLEVAPASVAAAILLRRRGIEVRLRGAGARRCFYFPQTRRLHYLSQGTRQDWNTMYASAVTADGARVTETYHVAPRHVARARKPDDPSRHYEALAAELIDDEIDDDARAVAERRRDELRDRRDEALAAKLLAEEERTLNSYPPLL
jgi:hypothetical protein